MSDESMLPTGQVEAKDFIRFGLNWFAYRFPAVTDRIVIEVGGDIEAPLTIEDQLRTLPRTEQVSDFNCVTSWSWRGLRWGGIRFRDFYDKIVVPNARPQHGANFVVLHGQDGYRNSMLLEDLLADDVLLVDTLDGKPLNIEHGAPLRLIAPAHYGYKNIKHLHRIEFWRDDRNYHFPGPGFLSHPRARIAFQ